MYVTEDTTRAAAGARAPALHDGDRARRAARLRLRHRRPRDARRRRAASSRFVARARRADRRRDVKIDWHGHQRPRPRRDQRARRARGGRRPGARLRARHRRARRQHARWTCCSSTCSCSAGSTDDLTARCPTYCEAVAEATGVPIPDNYPVVGQRRVPHRHRRPRGGGHQGAQEGRRLARRPRLLGRARRRCSGRQQVIEIGPMSGRSNVAFWLETHGIEPRTERDRGRFPPREGERPGSARRGDPRDRAALRAGRGGPRVSPASPRPPRARGSSTASFRPTSTTSPSSAASRGRASRRTGPTSRALAATSPPAGSTRRG